MCNIADPKPRIADKGGASIEISCRVKVRPFSIHRVTVGKAASSACGKALRLFHLGKAYGAPRKAGKFISPREHLRHSLIHCVRRGWHESMTLPLTAQEIKPDTPHIA